MLVLRKKTTDVVLADLVQRVGALESAYRGLSLGMAGEQERTRQSLKSLSGQLDALVRDDLREDDYTYSVNGLNLWSMRAVLMGIIEHLNLTVVFPKRGEYRVMPKAKPGKQ